MRNDQAADNRQTEGLASITAGAIAKGDRQRPNQSRHGCHHDGTESHQTPLVDGFQRRHVFVSLRRQGEIDLHDGILLHNADQHDQSDEPVDVEIHLEQPQRHQSAENRRRQTRKNRQRMDVTLVEDAEHDVNDKNRDPKKQRQIAHRI